MKRILLFLSLFLLLTAERARAYGEWTYHLAYQDVTACQPAGNRVYVLGDGNLFACDVPTSEVTFYSKQTGLSDKGIRFMGYSDTQRLLMLVYENGNIDLLDEEGNVGNMPELKNAYSDNLVLNNLCVRGDTACISTDEGVVCINLARREVEGYYRLGQKVYDATVFDGAYWAAQEDQLYACSRSANPLDISAWQPVQTARVRKLVPFAGGMYVFAEFTGEATAATAGLWWVTPAGSDGLRAKTRLTSETYTSFYADGSSAVFANSYKGVFYTPDAPTRPVHEWAQDNAWSLLTRDAGGTFWAACGYDGMQAMKWNDVDLQPTGVRYGGYGPRRDLCYYMTYVGERLLVAGGRLDPYDREHYPGTIMCYEDGEWSAFQEDGIAAVTGNIYRDITSVAQDPADATHHFATAAGTGLYEFRNGRLTRYFSTNNSPLAVANGGGTSQLFVRTDGLNFDKEGNLWMVNNSCDTVIRVLKADSTWRGIYVSDLEMAPTCEKTFFDRSGRFWVASRRSVSGHNGGLLCLDYNGTVDNIHDDVTQYRYQVTNQNGESYVLGGVYSLVEDRDGAIWFGSEGGVFVISDPSTWFDEDFSVVQPVVPRNDGTNYADYLLNEVPVTALAVDGGNRKWIGTGGSGLYLVSPDGSEVLESFTTDNSSLPSNFIYSLAVDAATGVVMIGTDVGLVSYSAGVTEPKPSLEKSNVKVYPNPVRPEYSGSVTVTGLTEGADIKVANVAGQVVGGGTAQGGSFIWDVRAKDGGRVPTGVYYIIVATGQGKKGVVAKVTVI